MNEVQPIRDPAKVEAIKKWLKARSARDWLLFVAGINSGLRISDLLKLRVRDVGGMHLVVRETKTRKRKFIRITPELRRAFKEYCQGLEADACLFPSRKGINQPISRAQAYRILKEAAAAHGLAHIGTHTLRKTFGFHFYQQTKDVAMLQELFNHSDPAITLRYIGVNQALLDKAMSQFKISA